MSFPDTTPSPAQVHPVLWIMAGLMVFLQGLQSAADYHLVPQIFNRWVLFSLFAFFDTSFEMARHGQGIHAQLIWSLVTYAFLHGGWLHLSLNVAVFLGLGHAITQAGGIRMMLLLFCVTAAAGALTLGVLADVQGPLVGASGAIFGFLGAFTAWQERLLAHAGMPRGHIWQRIVGLVILNVFLAIGLGGMLAWQAHLGGFVAGWLIALVFPAPGLALRAGPRPASGMTRP